MSAALFLILACLTLPANAAKTERPQTRKANPAHARPAPEVVLSSTPITVVFPPDGYAMDWVRGEFIFGTVNRPARHFRVNGSTVTVYRNGGWLAYMPVSPGTFTYICQLDLPGGTTSLTRTLYVRAPRATPPADSLAILPETVQPSQDLDLRAGDWLKTGMRATPGLAASFSIRGLRSGLPMVETSPGLYEGAYLVRPGDSCSRAQIELALVRGRRYARAAAKGRLTVPETSPGVAVVQANNAHIRSAPEQGFILFPPPGTPLVTTGRGQGYTRVWLSPDLSGWIDDKSIQSQAAGTPPPSAVLGTIRTSAEEGATALSLEMSQVVPFSIEESAELDRLTLRLFYTAGHTNWVVYDAADRLLRQVRWRQRGSDSVEVTIYLQPGKRFWGYDASWQDKSLRLELRHPPRFAPRPASVFKNRVIVIDPGHMPSAPGAIGPHGTLEMDANAWLAKDLQAMLIKEGAKPVLTRSSAEDEVSLGQRQRLSKGGEMFLSIHNNALSDGENPFEHTHGFSVFYYHPHSLALAREVYEAYERHVPMPGEGLRYGDLFVARITQMPSILTESAYMMIPEQEERLLNATKRRKFALAMLEGMRRFLEDERARQAPALTGRSRKTMRLEGRSP